MDYDYILYGYILQLFEMEKKKIVVIFGSLQAMIANLTSAFTAVWNIERKLSGKLKHIPYLLFPSLIPNVFVPELDIMNVNITSEVSLYL